MHLFTLSALSDQKYDSGRKRVREEPVVQSAHIMWTRQSTPKCPQPLNVLYGSYWRGGRCGYWSNPERDALV